MKFFFVLIFVPLFYSLSISNCTNLQNISNNLNTVNTLLNNIDCLGINFNPIGNSTVPFTGTLDGNGYTISNLNITTNVGNTGLFGNASGSTVKNITFFNLTVTSASGSNIGGLFGQCSGCTIDSIFFDNNSPNFNRITAISGLNVGGLIGNGINVMMTNCIIKNTIVRGFLFVGGLLGANNGSPSSNKIINSFNLGVSSDTSTIVVSGSNSVGGLFGSSGYSVITKCGVSNGVILSSNVGGGLSGILDGATVSECYVKSSVFVNGNITVGGLAGSVSAGGSLSKISDSYSRAQINGSTNVGGFFGIMATNEGFAISVSNSYTSSNVSGSNPRGAVVGLTTINTTYNCDFVNIFFDNSILTNYNGSRSCSSGVPTGLSCTDLFNVVNTTFNQSLWSGNNLVFENEIGYCSCPSGCNSTAPTLTPSTSTPSTTNPSTMTPSTLTPSTTPSTITPSTPISSTLSPSTTINSTINPNTTIPSTMIPSTTTPSTPIPSTQTPSTGSATPSTLIPSTIIPSTLTPSTTDPSTLTPSTLIPSTEIPSTQIPSTLPPTCIYKVPFCFYCPREVLNFDNNTFNVSCQFIESKWSWVFENVNNTVIQTNIQISNNTYFLGNASFAQNTTIVFNFNGNSNDTKLNVTGCLVVDGAIVININSKPNLTDFSLLLFQYSCDNKTVVIDESQVKVVPAYSKKSCDTSQQSLNNQQGSLSVSLKFNFKDCGKNIGLIVGLAVGIPVLLIIIFTVVLVVLKKNTSKTMKSYMDRTNSTNSNYDAPKDYVENKSFNNQTNWVDKGDVEMN